MNSATQIRLTATRLFADRGYEATSLQAISDAVGLTKQSLLYHYRSKETLRRAVLEAVFEHWHERLPRILEAVTSGRGRFEALTEELLDFFESDPYRARLVVRELLDHPDEMREIIARNLRPWVLLIAQFVRQGRDAGGIPPEIDPEAYITHVITLVVSSVAGHIVFEAALGDESEGARERRRQELLRMTRTALFTRTPDAREEKA